MRRSALVVVFALGACGGAEQGRESEPIANPGTGAAYSSQEPSEAIAKLAADFRGTCAFARPPGDAREYSTRVKAKPTEIGSIRVRATASFDVSDRDNLIGEVPSGTILAAAGPIANGSGADGTGYAVLVRDGHGLVCRGYVSGRSVEPSN
jgi:hypothetical protein